VKNESNGKLTGFIVGAVVGAAVGAGIALLVAPRTGKKTRNWLARSTREIKVGAANAFDEAKKTIQQETKGIAGLAAKGIASVHDLIQ
jgi:gas vesicle protein